MQFLDNLAIGFSAALTLANLAYAFVGCLFGTLIGVLPGIGPLAAISMLLPLTYALEPTSALIMLAGIYYGAQYGGSTTAILVNVPGEVSSVVTCLDGYQMARQGRAGPALTAAAVASLFAGCIGTLVLAILAAPLTQLAFKFGPAENFALMVLGLIGATVFAADSLLKAISMVVMGLLLGMVGTDVNSGIIRFSYGLSELADGIGFVIVAMSFFGITEILQNLETKRETKLVIDKISSLWPTRADARRAVPAALRGTTIGAVLGVLPGGGAAIAAFAAYAFEKKVSRYAAEFGKGAVEGVVSPEAANNAAAQTSFVPMLTLGLPSNAVMALMIGAMMIHNIQPGPQVMTTNPTLFWGLIVSMWLGNVMLIILNLPMVGLWVKLLNIPYRILYPAIIVFCMIGVYSINRSIVDVYLSAGFAVLGLILVKLDFPLMPLVLGFVLGPAMEEHFRRTLVLSHGDASVLFSRPLSLTLLLLAFGLLLAVLVPSLRSKRRETFQTRL